MATGRRKGATWLVALVSVLALTVGSVAFASSAAAAPGQGHGHAHAKTSKTDRGHKPASGRSSKASKSAVRHEKPNTYQAQADPDGMENGGVDQPGGQGGVNTTVQDGNNGSGNDLDCEDDNRGKGVPGHCTDEPTACERPGNGPGHAYGRMRQCAESTAFVPGEETPDGAPTTDPDEDTDAAPAPDAEPTDGTGTPAPEDGAAVPGTEPGMGEAEALAPDVLGVEAFAADEAVTKTSASAPSVPSAVSAGSAWSPVTGVLPNTGAGKALLVLAVVGVAAAAVGTMLMRRNRRTGGSL